MALSALQRHTMRRHVVLRPLLLALAVTLLCHVLVLALASHWLQPPSILRELAKPMYTRTLAPKAAQAPPAAAPAPVISKPNRPQAHIRQAQAAPETGANRQSGKAESPQLPASATELARAPDDATPAAPDAEPSAQAPAEASSAAEASAPSDGQPGTGMSGSEQIAAASAPASAASAPDPAFLETWPRDTRLTYHLSGNYRGELHGDAEVLWQRTGTRYQTVVQLNLGLLLSSRFTSQGDITEGGLRPELYEEQVRQRRRGVRLGQEDVRLNNGERVPRPSAVQDAASQFVELGHRFASGELQLVPGGQINFWLARPGGVDEWTYDVVGEETLHLPRLGAVQAIHLKPRPLAKPRGNIAAEMWFAPSLQYLPVRIRITQGAESSVDLLVDVIDQR